MFDLKRKLVISKILLVLFCLTAAFVNSPSLAHASGVEPKDLKLTFTQDPNEEDKFLLRVTWGNPTSLPAGVSAENLKFAFTLSTPPPNTYDDSRTFDYKASYEFHEIIRGAYGTYTVTVKVLNGSTEIGEKVFTVVHQKISIAPKPTTVDLKNIKLSLLNKDTYYQAEMVWWLPTNWPEGYNANNTKFELTMAGPGGVSVSKTVSPTAAVPGSGKLTYVFPNNLICNETTKTNCGEYKVTIKVMGTKDGKTTKIGETSVTAQLKSDGTQVGGELPGNDQPATDECEAGCKGWPLSIAHAMCVAQCTFVQWIRQTICWAINHLIFPPLGIPGKTPLCTE